MCTIGHNEISLFIIISHQKSKNGLFFGPIFQHLQRISAMSNLARMKRGKVQSQAVYETCAAIQRHEALAESPARIDLTNMDTLQ